MELENLILKIYHDTGKWIADCVGTGPGVGGGPDQSSSNQDERRELGNDCQIVGHLAYPDGSTGVVIQMGRKSQDLDENSPEEDTWELM